MGKKYMTIVRYLSGILISVSDISTDKSKLLYWSQQLFVVMSSVVIIFSLPLFIYGSVLFFSEGAVIPGIIELVIYIFMTVAICNKSISIEIRKIVMLVVILGTGIFLLLVTGTNGAGMLCIISVLFISGMFLKEKALVIFVLVNIFIMGVLSILLSAGVLDNLAISTYKGSWFINVGTAQLLGICSMALVRVVFIGLERQIETLRESRLLIREREKIYRRMFEYAPMPYQSLDKSGVVVDANIAWQKLTGHNSAELKNLTVRDILEETQIKKFNESFVNLLNTGYIDTNFIVLNKNGDKKTVRFICSTSNDQEGNFIQAHCLMQDITDELEKELIKREEEAQLINQQKLEAIGTLAAGVAHEINNPLNGIMNYAQIILDSLEDCENKEFAEEIIVETERIAVIVRNLLGFSRHDDAIKTQMSYEEIIERTLSLVTTFTKKDQISIELIKHEEPLLILCICQQIQQIVMNLITNAKDALNDKYKGYHENKKIVISTELITRDKTNYARLIIEDYGNGIPESIKSRIFDPFFTTKGRDRGTGLGLAISHKIASNHGGKLSFETKEGEYTRVFLDLPLYNAF